MPILRCPNCRVKLRVDNSAMGKTKRCPKCREPFTAGVQPGQSRFAEFLQALPIKFPLYGCWVTLQRSGNRVGVDVAEETTDDPLPELCQLGAEIEPWLIEKIKLFLTFFLKTPVGPEMFLKEQRLSELEGWGSDLNQMIWAWESLQQPLDDDGQLQTGISCIGRDVDGFQCSNVTKDPSGLCHVHNKPDAKTLLNSLPKWLE